MRSTVSSHSLNNRLFLKFNMNALFKLCTKLTTFSESLHFLGVMEGRNARQVTRYPSLIAFLRCFFEVRITVDIYS